MGMKFVIGIDEAGRGPLAGPVTVGSFGTTEKTAKLILKNFFDGKLRDSKKLSQKKREEIFAKLSLLKKEGVVSFEVAHSTAKFIDKFGISKAIGVGVKKSLNGKTMKCLARLTEPSTRNFSAEKYPCISELSMKKISKHDDSEISEICEQIEIRLDGLLKAPPEYESAGWRTKTIIKGDEKDIFIACASIVAKVSRDRLMCKLAKKYPLYGFEIHKGYGTASHRNLIKILGPSLIHRRSFCKNI
jgi:ribonuclease HII